MVSTAEIRGVKFKFTEGERVLCYEPDPTKAKVLYESKVLDLVPSRDERGRKVPEYLIHFFGWNSSWDRCVREEFILPYTEENSDLQIKLATEAALTIKGKRKIKLPPLIKESLAKQQCAEAGKDQSEKQTSSGGSSSDTDSSEDESGKEVVINIPEVLKQQLEEDYKCITQRDKFVKLPCKPNVIAILEAYVKCLAAKLLCSAPPKNAKNAKNGTQLSEDVKNKLNLCKETMDGVRVYFDFTLPHLLLYRQEKKQLNTEGIKCAPISPLYKWEPKETDEAAVVKVERRVTGITFNRSENVHKASSLKREHENILPSHSRGKKSLRSQSTKMNPLCNMTNGDTEQKVIKTEQIEKVKKSKKYKKQRPKPATTRVLRSREKQNEELSPQNSPASPSLAVAASKHPPASPDLPSPVEPSNSPRVTRKSTLHNMSPPRMSSPTPQAQVSRPPCVEEKPVVASLPPVVPINQPLPSFCSPTNFISSSNSSSHSPFSNKNIGQQFHLINNAALLQEILSWRLIPQHLYEPIPAAPSLIYGAHHLLRLFVKLPELLSKMNISRKKLIPLLDILENLLNFIAEKKNELFYLSAYCDACVEEYDKSVCSTK